MKAPDRQPVADRPCADAKSCELPARHDAMLAVSKGGDLGVTRKSPTF